ncbi:hypothetical protein PC128_g18442 [Phytophthora cactorum]|nr:hypothetical protein PC121_g22399 [Phytophthora cactorum]KAG3172773.1 hypothetical protein PC128_g18442 [Phytophthora cactorum]
MTENDCEKNYEKPAAPTKVELNYYAADAGPVVEQTGTVEPRRNGGEVPISEEHEEPVAVGDMENVGGAMHPEREDNKGESTNDKAESPIETNPLSGLDTECAVSSTLAVNVSSSSLNAKPCDTERHEDTMKDDEVVLLTTARVRAENALDTLSEDAEVAVANRIGSVTEADTKPQKRLFTSQELEALTAGESLGVAEETVEYDKELEDRLYYVDEVELESRIKESTEQ